MDDTQNNNTQESLISISRLVVVGVRILWNLRHSPAGYVPIRLADIRRGSCRRTRRLRGDSRQRGAVHSRLW